MSDAYSKHMKLAAAQSSKRNFDNYIRLFFDLRQRSIFDRDIVRAVEDDGLHTGLCHSFLRFEPLSSTDRKIMGWLSHTLSSTRGDEMTLPHICGPSDL